MKSKIANIQQSKINNVYHPIKKDAGKNDPDERKKNQLKESQK